jgi:radical SAM-linked protein
MKLVFEFTKTGDLIYISHLDLMRLWLRVLRMAGLRPAYSHGFNPHPKMSFALPLSLGVHSTCELLEFETEAVSNVSEVEAAVLRVNERLPEGARVTWWREKPDDFSKSLAARVAAATYEFMCDGIMDAPVLLEAFFARESVVVWKRDKKSGANVEKEMRAEMSGYRIVKDMRGRMLAEATLAAAPGRTLGPGVFFAAFCEASGLDAKALSPVVTRTAILGTDGKTIIQNLSDDAW